MVTALLLAAGVLSSYILAPFIYGIFALLIGLDIYSHVIIPHFLPRIYLFFHISWGRNKKACTATRALNKSSVFRIASSIAIFIGLTGYFILQAKSWANKGENFLDWSNFHKGWDWFLVSESILFLGCFFSLFNLKKALSSLQHLSYAALLLPPLIALPFSGASDVTMKTVVFLRILFIPPAAAGLVWCWNKLKNLILLRFILLELPLIYFCCLSVLLIGRYFSESYIKREPAQARVLKKMQRLPFDTKILFLTPDQEIAAVSSHLVYMQYPYRETAYIPPQEQPIFSRFFDQRQKIQKSEADFIYADNTLIKTSRYPTHINEVISLSELTDWQLWSATPEAPLIYQKETKSLNSGQYLIDACLHVPILLAPGHYEITIQVVGKVLEGAAHLSLMGGKKLITIPAGNYDNPTTFYALIFLEEHGFNGRLAFGLGGWSLGRGEIQLKTLKINQLFFT